MYAGDEFYGDEITSPLAQSTDTRYCLYIIYANGREEMIERFWYRKYAVEKGERFIQYRLDTRYEIVEEEV